MITFTKITPADVQEYTAVKSVTMTCDDESTVEEMYVAFDDFLRACGYVVDYDLQKDNDNDPYYHEATAVQNYIRTSQYEEL